MTNCENCIFWYNTMEIKDFGVCNFHSQKLFNALEKTDVRNSKIFTYTDRSFSCLNFGLRVKVIDLQKFTKGIHANN